MQHSSSETTPDLQPQPTTRVLIIGGGPVGLCLAALLAKQGIYSTVVELDASYCTGSRAICVSRRSQEIMAWAGAADALQGKGLPWVGGRSYFQNTEVLHFSMPSEAGERFAPMVNIQQYYIEQFAHEAMQASGDCVELLWGHRFVSLEQDAQGVTASVQTPQGQTLLLRGAYLVACDGGRSAVREHMGLTLKGKQYEGRYVIVDIQQASQRPTERLAWFDPPSNPGSTILMHRQPDDVWRVDYQIDDDEDALEAVKPENVLPRVQSHLTKMGEHAPWHALWISIYNAKCLTLDNYRHGRTFFAGDAAHLVPIFGVRGLNSGLDDAANLAWKLAAAMQPNMPKAQANALLDTYSTERLQATHENLAYGAKSTEFMAPPNAAFSLLRQATLRLAVHNPRVRSLINPRQSLPVRYVDSYLHAPASQNDLETNLVGSPAPDAQLVVDNSSTYLSAAFGQNFVCLQFGAMHAGQLNGAMCVAIADSQSQAFARYGISPQCQATVLVRPDGYVQGVWQGADLDCAQAQLRRLGIDRLV